MKQIKWDTTVEEIGLIEKIVNRAMRQLHGLERVSLDMDITATHCNGTPLNLEKLLLFDLFNFAHDIYGIVNHIDRTTGILEDCFLPRSAM